MPSPAPKHFWFKSGLRFCGSCCVTLACWTLWLALGALLVALLSIAFAKELPVPDHALRRIERALARSGLVLNFGRARFDPTGKVLLQDVKLRTARFEDPLLTCRLLYVRHDFWSLLAGWTFPDEIQIEGAALQLPAMLAPSGTTEPVVRDLAVTLRRRGQVWHVEQFAGRLGPLALTLRGELTPPRGTAATPDLEKLTERFLQTARRVAPGMSRLDAFDRPALDVQLATGATGANRALLRFTAAGANRPWDQPVTTGPLVARTALDLGRGPQAADVRFAVGWAEGPAGLAARLLRGELVVGLTPDPFGIRPEELRLAALRVETPEGPVHGPVLRADLVGWPAPRIEAAARLGGEFLAVEAEGSLTEKSARLHAVGRGHPDFINAALARHTPRAAPFFQFGDPVAFDAEAVLAPGWRFDRLAAWADAGRIDSRGVRITAARGRIDLTGASFLAHDARIAAGGSAARGSYWMDFGTTDYRMLLAGRLHPADINGWFRGDWWASFWNRWFAFATDAPPAAEVDIRGRWKQPWLSQNFVRAHVRSATVWGGDFEAVDATVFVRPGFAHGLALTGTRAGGTQRVAGSFKRFGTPGGRETDRFEFDFDTNADPAVLGRMLEGRADEVLASLRFTAPPHIHAWGTLSRGADGALVPDWRLAAEAAAPLHYYGFPLASARVQGAVTGQGVRLDDIRFAAAGGAGAGKAALTGAPGARLLGFDLFLNKARLGDTVHAVQEYDATRTGRPPPAGPDSKFVRTAAQSLLDVSLSALGNPASLASFKGSGQAALTGGELGEVHLFGLLSQVLSSLSLKFSSLKFDAAHSAFTLDRGELYFPDLKVTGPSATIDARGRYSFATNALDFTARFKPYDQTDSLLAAAVSIVINPLTSILELKLNGPLGDPKWSVLVSPGPRPSLAPEPPAETPSTPAR
ncbi:MAG: AsmA-like C-terminal region-containing protein [Verrucomicrobiota bacterium]